MSDFLPDALIATLRRPRAAPRPPDRGFATARVSVDIAFPYDRRR